MPAPRIEAIGKGHVSVRSPKLQLAELWVQALGEASEDPELKRHLRRHMREVHDFVADLVRRGQEQGAIATERDADSEAWIMLAGGILGMVGRRVGLLDDGELQAIRAARAELAARRRRRRRASNEKAPAAAPGPSREARHSGGFRGDGSAAHPSHVLAGSSRRTPCEPRPGVRPGCKVRSL